MSQRVSYYEIAPDGMKILKGIPYCYQLKRIHWNIDRNGFLFCEFI
ncbi:hypothetical protein [Peribacillus butanolivorans]